MNPTIHSSRQLPPGDPRPRARFDPDDRPSTPVKRSLSLRVAPCPNGWAIRAAARLADTAPRRSRYAPGIIHGLLALLAACSPAGDAPPSAGNSASPAWPGDEWPVSAPAAEGLDPAAVASLVADIDAGSYGLVDHFLLIRNGRVVADRRWDHSAAHARILAEQADTTLHQYNYDHPAWHPYYRDTDLHSLQSVTKSVLSVAFGIAIDRGHIPGVRTPAWFWFESHGVDIAEPRRARTTVEDFLTMRSGIVWARPGQGYDDETHPTVVLEASEDWIGHVVGQPMGTDPGTEFDYNDGVSVLLGKIVREATGQRLDQWAAEHLFRPIGIDEHYWKLTPEGEVDSEGGLYLATHDLARIGYLMLRGGEWDGRQIVSREWVEASTAPVVEEPGYGYQWWVPLHENGETRIFAANGYGGQFLHVAPELDLISVFNGWTLHEQPEMSSWTAFQERILPAVVSR